MTEETAATGGSSSESDGRVGVEREAVIRDLGAAVGAEHVLTGEVAASYCVDWTRRFRGESLAVVRPGSTGEVASVVRICSAAGVSVVPQGGNTGLVGGSVPATAGPPAVVVSTQRLNWLEPVDPVSGQVTVGAGTTVAAVHDHVGEAGWAYGVDLTARDSATIGGNLATNAGGIRVLAYGMTRAQVVGVEAVLPDGSVISRLGGLLKDNTGLDLAGVLCGSEGTLGIITAARLRLHRPHGRTSVALVGCSGIDDSLEIMVSALRGRLVAAEVMDSVSMSLVEKVAGLPHPVHGQHAYYALLEVADGGTGDGFVEQVLNERDVAVGCDASDVQRLWQYRERQAEAFATLGVIHKLDISLPLSHLAACVQEITQISVTDSRVSTVGIFGHLADGNMHVEIHGPEASDTSTEEAIFECVSRWGGAISAEHGIGRAKNDLLHLSRSEAEIRAMQAIKDAWDPSNVMNPGVLFAS